MFALVNDVADYPKRFDWCEAAEVSADGPNQVIARMDVRFNGIGASFTTRNTADAPHSIRLELVEGPFRELRGEWRFVALRGGGCRIELDLDFDFAGNLLGSALALGFGRFADRLVDEFVNAAKFPT